MKKIILSVALIFSACYLMAQDEAVVQLFYGQKQYEKAKEQVDKWLASPKLKNDEKISAYLWKLTIYSQLYSDPALRAKYPGADQEALDALQNYEALEPSLKQLKANYAGGVGSLYNESFNQGKDYFQNKQWDSAFKYFSQAERLGNFLLVNKLSSSTAAIDTVTTLYTGYAAQNAKKLDSAAKYYKIIADLKVAGPDYEDMYKFLIEYSLQNKNDADFKKYLALAKELYPNDSSVWTQYEMNNMTANTSLMDMLQKYQQDAAAGGLSEDKLIGYAEALATNDQTQLGSLDSMQKISLKLAAAQAFGKAFEMNNTNGLYAFNVGVIYYSIYSDLDDRYHSYAGESAAFKAKRTEIAKEEMAYADTASQWLEKAYPVLKAKTDRTRPETSSLNRTVGYLANIYMWDRDQTKVNGNSKDYDKYDALYKKYDAEYNIYK